MSNPSSDHVLRFKRWIIPILAFATMAVGCIVLVCIDTFEKTPGAGTPTNIQMSELWNEMARIDLDLELARRQRGVPLSEFEFREGVTADLHEMFTDPWGSYYAYRICDGRSVVYSLGPNRIDDGMRGDDMSIYMPQPFMPYLVVHNAKRAKTATRLYCLYMCAKRRREEVTNRDSCVTACLGPDRTDGPILDEWGMECRVTLDDAGGVAVRSSGPDAVMFTEDDIASTDAWWKAAYEEWFATHQSP